MTVGITPEVKRQMCQHWDTDDFPEVWLYTFVFNGILSVLQPQGDDVIAVLWLTKLDPHAVLTKEYADILLSTTERSVIRAQPTTDAHRRLYRRLGVTYETT